MPRLQAVELLPVVEPPQVVELLLPVVEPQPRAVELPLVHLPARPQVRGGLLLARQSARPNR